MHLNAFASHYKKKTPNNFPTFRHQNLGFTGLDDEKFLAHITWTSGEGGEEGEEEAIQHRTVEARDFERECIYPYNVRLVV